MTLDDAIGSAGVGLLLMAFALVNWGVLAPRSRVTGAMNVFGAGLSAYASWRIGYLPFVVLEGTWMLVAMEVWIRGPREPKVPSP